MTISLAIQVITTHWHKSERGAPHATQRSMLPQAFAMLPGRGPVSIQLLRRSSGDVTPQPSEQRHTTSLDFRVQALRFDRSDPDQTRVSFVGNDRFVFPRRHPIPDLLKLTAGCYARLLINYGLTHETRGIYVSQVINIGTGEDVALNRFVSSPPDMIRDLSENLR